MTIEKLKKEMIQMKKWAVVGVTEDKSKYGYKIFKKLNDKGYITHGVNPKYSEIEGYKIYTSIKDVPEKVDCVSVVVNPKISSKLLDDVSELGIKNVWFQPGSFDEETINKAKELGLNIVYYDCLYVELG
ncbi:CoA-binding protein [Tepidibacter aestuarii]|uniref:CoA-binding protein n=1 Tax=Tepidibacter aestuarii TaxID=2925782 RepID=UPI0020C0DA64|nr:CoA-binding protein [Tepidibacter aestuarii]CAH2212584.1 CoA_binding domain-containing protein [Tepidibacter aestuarii]